VALTVAIIFYFWGHETIHADCPFVPGRPVDDFLCDQKANPVGECIQGDAFKTIRGEDHQK
jgi:hypothetical protein